MNSPILTYSEAGEWLKVDERTIRRYIDAGDLPVLKIGGARRVHISDLENFVSRHRVIKCRTERKDLKTGTSHGRMEASNVHDLVAQLTTRKQKG